MLPRTQHSTLDFNGQHPKYLLSSNQPSTIIGYLKIALESNRYLRLTPRSLEIYQSCVKTLDCGFLNGWTTAPTPIIIKSNIQNVVEKVKFMSKLNRYSQSPKKTTPNHKNLTLRVGTERRMEMDKDSVGL